MSMRGRGKKGQNVARLQRVSPDGLICAYEKTDADIFETADAFLMKLNLDKKALSVIHRGPIVFMFDLESRRLCGIFQAFEAQSEEFAVYKVDVRVRERCLPLDWPELRKVVAENDLKLNKFPEILSPDQVLSLSDAFRKASQPLPPYSHPASVLEDRFYEHHQRGGYSQPQFALWDHQFEDPLNDAETRVRDGGGYSRQLDGHTVNLMEPPMTYATTATVDPSRQMNPGWKQQPELGLKTVLCSSASDHQLAYGHPIASQRSSISNAEENGFVYPRQARSVYSTAIPFECAEGMFHQQQQLTPLGVPLGKNGDERVPGKQYVQSPAAAAAANHSAEVSYKAAPMHKKVRDESVAKASSRESAFNRINGLEAATKSSVKRAIQLQAEPSCLENNRQAKNKRKQPKPPEKVSVFCRLQRPKPQSVFNRIECTEVVEIQQQQQQKQQQLQKQEKQQFPQQKPRQQQLSERRKRDDELQANSRQAQSKMIRTSRKKSPERQEDLLPECFESSSIPDFRRRLKDQSVDKADNDCSRPDNNLPKPKRRRFVRPKV